ncbi:MAG: MFS transporter, partial [Thermoplasmata archaeon]
LKMFKEVPNRVKWIIYLSCFSTVGYGYFFIVISAYLPEIGLNAGDVGLLLGVNGISFAVTAIPLGIVADRRGRKKMQLLGLLGIPPMLMVYAFTIELAYLLIASVIAGIAEGAFMSSWNAIIADLTTVETRNAAFVFSFIVGNVPFGVGFILPLFFPTIEEATGWGSHAVHSGTFFVLALLSIISPIGIWHVLRGYRERLSPGARLIRGKSTNTLLKFSGINSLIGLGAGFIIPLVPTWLFLMFGVPDSHSGPLLAVSSITIGLAAVFSTPLASRYGNVRAIVMTQAFATAFMLSLAYAPTALLAGGLYIARAALMNMASPIADAYLMGIISKDSRSFASALNALVWRLPNSASTVVGGIILGAGHYDIPFYLATAFYAGSVTLFYVVFKDVKPTG